MSSVIVVSTRPPTFPLSGGMAPQVAKACQEFDHAIWIAVESRDNLSNAFRAAVKGKPELMREMELALEKGVQETTVAGISVKKLIFSGKVFNGHYNNFSNKNIWPISHDRPDLVEVATDEDIADNETVNRGIAQAIVEQLKKTNDKTTPIWVQDYQHKGLARILREMDVENPILFFNHIPDASPETLNALSERERDIYLNNHKDLLFYDAVNFQTERNARRAQQYFGIKDPVSIGPYETFKMQIGNFNLKLGNFPISIDTPSVTQKALGQVTGEIAKELESKMTAPVILINFERCDYSKGIDYRLQALELLLEENPQLAGQVQIVIGAEPTRKDIKAYQNYANDVRVIADRINSHREWYNGDNPPVLLLMHNIDNTDVLPLLRQKEDKINIGLVTAPVDGMNLVCKEFVAAQAPDNAGRLIISGGIGAAAELDQNGEGALVYHHYDASGDKKLDRDKIVVALKDAIKAAIEMPQAEANDRCATMRRHIDEYDLTKWASNHVKLIQAISKEKQAANDLSQEVRYRLPEPSVIGMHLG